MILQSTLGEEQREGRDKIYLIQNHNNMLILLLYALREIVERALKGVRLCGIQHHYHNGGFAQLCKGALYANNLHSIKSLPNARSINKSEHCTANIHKVLYSIAGGAVHIGDNSLLLSAEGIQQSALSSIGSPHNCHWDTILNCIAKRKRVRQRICMLLNLQQQTLKLTTLCKLHLLLAEVKFQLHKREQVKHLLAHLLKLIGKTSPHLFNSKVVRSCSLARDKVCNCLCLS